MLLKCHSEKLFVVRNRNRTLQTQVNYLRRVRKEPVVSGQPLLAVLK